MSDNVNLNVQFSGEIYSALQSMANDSGLSKGDVMSRALALMLAARTERKKGRHLGFAKKVQNLDQEIVGF